MKKNLSLFLFTAAVLLLTAAQSNAQISLLQDYQNTSSAVIGTFQGNSYREAGFSSLYPIPGTNGQEFWTCSDRGFNVDCASANTALCRPTYDKMFGFPTYAPKIHRIRITGTSVQILQTIAIKRPDGTPATGLINPTGLGSTAAEQASTDTVLNCANFSLKIAAKDTFGIDPEGILVDKNGFFWLSEEGGATIWKLSPSGVLIKRYTPYYNLAGLQSVDAPIDTVFKYRKNNRGFESIALAPNGKIYAIIQSPILYPTKAIGEATRVHRMLELDPNTGIQRMFVYLNDGIIDTGANQIRLLDWKIGDMAAINDSTFLVIEAAARGTNDIKRVYQININQATPVHSGLYGTQTLEALVDSAGIAAFGIKAVKKTLVMDLLANGWPSTLDKSEGIAIVNDSTVAFCNDNDFGQTCPLANGIAIPTTNTSHVVLFRLSGAKKLSGYVAPLPTALSQGISGANSSATPYIQPTAPGVVLTSIITTPDSLANGYKMAGIPDGLGAFDNGNGTFTLLMNHELTNTTGVTRAHGSIGSFVSKWVINKSNLSVVSGQDLMQNVNLYDTTTQTFTTYNSTNPSTKAIFGRFCSADLPPVAAFYNAGTGKGTQERIFMNGEETNDESRAMAHIVTGTNAGTSWELPALGKAAWENAVATPSSGDKTVVALTNDGTDGQVYFYIGTKTTTGTEVDKAGLTNGTPWGVKVTGFAAERTSTTVINNPPTPGTRFSLVDMGNVKQMSGVAFNTASNTAGVTKFSRPEDGSWDPSNPNDFYFNTTDQLDQVTDGIGTQVGRSRVWRLRFDDIKNPALGGTVEAVLDGTEGHNMLDNMAIDKFGHILLQEDVGNAAHNGKIWQYTIATDQLKMITKHDPSRFGDIGVAATAPFNQDEETSGIIDVQDILGAGMFLTSDQAHYAISGAAVEGGQLLALYNPDTYTSFINNPEISVAGNTVNITDGDTTTSAANLTNFGSTNIGNTIIKSFVIQNAGPGALIVSGVNFTGANASEFTLSGAPTFPLTIAANASNSINVKFTPTVVGSRKATINILSNDIDEATFDFALSATATAALAPEINVTGNNVSIVDGDVTPSLTDSTDFGSIKGASTRTYTIQNLGSDTLRVTGITFTGTNATDFSLVSAPAFPWKVLPTANQTITVKLTPSVLGVRTATINIANNDADESNYDFVLQGTYSNVGLKEISAISSLSVYPNPTMENATLSIMSNKAQNSTVAIYDITGKEVVSGSSVMLTQGRNDVELSTASLQNGLYLVQVIAQGKATTVKLVVMH